MKTKTQTCKTCNKVKIVVETHTDYDDGGDHICQCIEQANTTVTPDNTQQRGNENV